MIPRIIYIFNEIIIFIPPIKYIYSMKELKYFYSIKWSLNIWPTKYNLENWNPVFIFYEFTKGQDSHAHGSGWMLVICKHWNWNWHWDWKYYIFLTKGGDIFWLTASTKLGDLLITWSRDKCKALYLPFRNTYDHQT